MSRISDLAEDITDSYDDIIRKIPFIQHLDNDNSSTMFWETYMIEQTVFRFYLHIDIDETEYTAVVTQTLEIDPDYMNHKDFTTITNTPDVYKFDVDLEDYDDGDSDKERLRVYDELKKGFDKQVDALREGSQNVLLKIENDLKDSPNADKSYDILVTEHYWILTEWVRASEMIDFSGFNINEIPKVLEAFNLAEDERYLPQEVKDMFIF